MEKSINIKNITISFDALDLNHKYCNLGPVIEKKQHKNWIIDLFECLQNISKMTYKEFSLNKTYDWHPINWETAVISKPPDWEEREYHQFRINKTRGRVVAEYVGGILYIIWFDPDHAITNSSGYQKTRKCYVPPSEYEMMNERINQLIKENEFLKEENEEHEKMFNEKASKEVV